MGGAIQVFGLTAQDARVTTFIVECYSDSGLTTLVASGAAPAIFDQTSGLSLMVGIVTLTGLTNGSTYYLRSCSVIPVFGPSTWSGTQSAVAGSDGIPASTRGNNSDGYWVEDSGGYIHQWGTVTTVTSGLGAVVNFPTPFTTAASISVVVTANFGQTTGATINVQAGTPSTSSFYVVSYGDTGQLFWQADGY
jgi:hypothetical protein